MSVLHIGFFTHGITFINADRDFCIEYRYFTAQVQNLW